MNDLMVKREARFHRCRVTDVEEELAGICLRVGFSAETAEWFSPEESNADPDGWLRQITGVSAEFRIIGDNHAALLARARRWQEDGTLLEGFSDLNLQALGLYAAGVAERGPEDVLVVSMNPKEMDTP